MTPAKYQELKALYFAKLRDLLPTMCEIVEQTESLTDEKKTKVLQLFTENTFNALFDYNKDRYGDDRMTFHFVRCDIANRLLVLLDWRYKENWDESEKGILFTFLRDEIIRLTTEILKLDESYPDTERSPTC